MLYSGSDLDMNGEKKVRTIGIAGGNTMRILIVLFVIVLSPVFSIADTLYVSDQLVITVREGQGNEYKIIKTLKTGTPVEVIEESEDHMLVRTKDGKEGWVLKRYLTADTPKEEIIAGLQVQIESLKKKIKELESGRKSVQDQLAIARQDHATKQTELSASVEDKDSEIESLRKNLEDLTSKYNYFLEQSKDAVAAVKERDELAGEKAALVSERDILKRENDRLNERMMIYWFLAGAGVFFLGWMSGKLSRKKKRYY